MTKGNWIVLLCAGLLFLIAAMPSKGAAASWRGMLGLGGAADPSGVMHGDELGGTDKAAGEMAQAAASGNKGTEPSEAGKFQEAYLYTYEALMERRVKEVLAKVEGVGEVDVLIVLKSSEQKVYQVDGSSLYSSTKEQDISGGMREIVQQEEEHSTVLAEGGSTGLQAGLGSSGGANVTGGSGPLLEKEIRPEVSGIVISAQGGGEALVKAEITAAMEALFDLPAHKIKVLKRAE